MGVSSDQARGGPFCGGWRGRRVEVHLVCRREGGDCVGQGETARLPHSCTLTSTPILAKPSSSSED